MDLGYRIMMTMGGWQWSWCHWARLGRGILEKVFIPNVLTLSAAGPARPGHMRCAGDHGSAETGGWPGIR